MFVDIISFNGGETLFVQSGSYKIGDKGSMNCPEGSSIVKNEDECRTSADVFNMPFKTVECTKLGIAGCFANVSDNTFSFNTCTKTNLIENNRNKTHAAVCKGKYF